MEFSFSPGIETEPTRPYILPSLDEETVQVVNEVIHSGWIRSGPKLLVFEEALNSYLRGTCMVDSFTALGFVTRLAGIRS